MARPPYIDARETLREEVEEDVAPLRSLSLEQRGKILESVCRDAMAIMRARPDFKMAMQQREARSAWDEIVTRFHKR